VRTWQSEADHGLTVPYMEELDVVVEPRGRYPGHGVRRPAGLLYVDLHHAAINMLSFACMVQPSIRHEFFDPHGVGQRNTIQVH